MNKKMKFAIWIIFLALVGVLISWWLATKFSLLVDEKYIDIIITTAVFLAGFGLIALDKKDRTKSNPLAVFLPNIKSIIIWSIASIVFAFCFLTFQGDENLKKMFFSLSVGFLFFTITLIVLLVLYHDNPYLNELETVKPKLSTLH